MATARFVKIDGLDAPCLLVSGEADAPEELVIDYPADGGEPERKGVVYRLQPSSSNEPRPVYVEVFDE